MASASLSGCECLKFSSAEMGVTHCCPRHLDSYFSLNFIYFYSPFSCIVSFRGRFVNSYCKWLTLASTFFFSGYFRAIGSALSIRQLSPPILSSPDSLLCKEVYLLYLLLLFVDIQACFNLSLTVTKLHTIFTSNFVCWIIMIHFQFHNFFLLRSDLSGQKVPLTLNSDQFLGLGALQNL